MQADLISQMTFQSSINDFFSKMFDDILAGRVTLESILLVFAFFGSFVGLTSLSYIFAKKPKEVMLEQPITWVTDFNRIMELLDSAIVQRSKVRVSFHRDLGAARSTDGTLLEVNKDFLMLEMTSVKTINPAWVGRSLELMFRLRLPEQPQLQSTFSFISEILSYEQLADDVMELKVSRPLRLELNQNRMHLRVEPPDKYIRTFKLWTEEQVRRHGDSRDPDTWGDPMYVTEIGGPQELKMENISGGGLLVEISPGALRSKNNKITLNQQYYSQLTLADPDMSGFTTYYVLMRVLKCRDDCDSKSDLSLGMAYVSLGTPYDPPLTGLRWRTVNRDYGVRELDDWSYELHLELYRNKGIA